jgi:hypothetical protein
LSLYDLAGINERDRLSALVKAADRDSADCRIRIARNDQIKAECQLALIRTQLEEAECE